MCIGFGSKQSFRKKGSFFTDSSTYSVTLGMFILSQLGFDDFVTLRVQRGVNLFLAKLRKSFCPAAASHSRPRQAGASQTARTNLHLSVSGSD